MKWYVLAGLAVFVFDAGFIVGAAWSAARRFARLQEAFTQLSTRIAMARPYHGPRPVELDDPDRRPA
jgi:hypothetical protein